MPSGAGTLDEDVREAGAGWGTAGAPPSKSLPNGVGAISSKAAALPGANANHGRKYGRRRDEYTSREQFTGVISPNAAPTGQDDRL